MKFDLKGAVKWFGLRWNTPAKGNFVPFKEIAAYSVGGIGVQFIAAISNLLAMTAGSLLVGSVYGITPIEMQMITVISQILTILFVPIRGIIMDNSKSKQGKYRPIILWTIVPATIILVAMAYIPMSATHMTKLILIGIGFNLITIIYNQLLYIGYTNLVQVISPNTDERTAIVSVSSIIYSLAPTITGFLMPMIAEATNSTMVDIKVYRIMFPVFGILGLLFAFFSYFGTKERVVVGKSHKNKVKFLHGMKSVISNKYLWIVNIQTIFVFARNASVIILNWVFVYQMQNNIWMSLLTTLMGTASLIGMLIAPILSKIIGKRNLIMLTHLIYAIAYGLTFFCVSSPIALFILIYIANAANATSLITGPALNADMLDYQQWKSGERLDGFFMNFQILISVIGMATGFVIPFVTESYGLLTNYDVLYDAGVRGSLIKILAVISFVGGIASLIPFFFYDLTEKKHKGIIRDLERRALKEDLNNGVITEEEFNEKNAYIDKLEQEELEKESKKAKKNKKSKKSAKNVSDEQVSVDMLNQEENSTGVATIDGNNAILENVAEKLQENDEDLNIDDVKGGEQ